MSKTRLRGVGKTTKGKSHTSSILRTDLPVAGVARVASSIADPCVNQTLSGTEVLPVQVLDTPEAAGGDGGLLRALGYRHRRPSPAGARHSELRGPAAHGTEQPRDEVWKREGGGHDGYRDSEYGPYGGGCGVLLGLVLVYLGDITDAGYFS